MIFKRNLRSTNAKRRSTRKRLNKRLTGRSACFIRGWLVTATNLRRNSGKSSQSGLTHLWQPNDIALTPFLGEHITIGGMDFVEPTKASLMHGLSHRRLANVRLGSKVDMAASTCDVRETTCSITAAMCNLYFDRHQPSCHHRPLSGGEPLGRQPAANAGRSLDARTMGRGEGASVRSSP